MNKRNPKKQRNTQNSRQKNTRQPNTTQPYHTLSGFAYKQIRLVQIENTIIKALRPESDVKKLIAFEKNIELNYYLKVGAIINYYRKYSVFNGVEQAGYFLIANGGIGIIQARMIAYKRSGNKTIHFDEEAPINSIVPKYHKTGGSDATVFNCIRIYCAENEIKRKKFTARTSIKLKSPHFRKVDSSLYGLGFEQLSTEQCFHELKRINKEIESMTETEPNSYVAIYVPKNTTLLMIDTFESITKKDRDHERTVFQEGSVVLLENIELQFNDFHYTKGEKGYNTIDVFDFDELKLKYNDTLKDNKKLNPIFILKPVDKLVEKHNSPELENTDLINTLQDYREAYLTLWGLSLYHDMVGNNNNKKLAVLQIPQDGHIERVYEWGEGVDKILDKMASNPWNKYMCIKGKEIENTEFKYNEFTGPYPGYNPNVLRDIDWSVRSDSQRRDNGSAERDQSQDKSQTKEPKKVSDLKPDPRSSDITKPIKPNELTETERTYINRMNKYEETAEPNSQTPTVYHSFDSWTTTPPPTDNSPEMPEPVTESTVSKNGKNK